MDPAQAHETHPSSAFVPAPMPLPRPMTPAVLVPAHPRELQRQQKARNLVVLSNALGWGGLALLFMGSAVTGVLVHSLVAVTAVAGLGALAAVAGAIIGQVGRGLQGRVI